MGRFEERRSGGEGHADIAFLARTLADWMVFNDPPRHRELRRAMQNAFLARDIPVLEANVRAVVDELLDPLGAEGRMDLVADFAHPLPAIVIAELFGMPRTEREQLKGWSDALGRFVLGDVENTAHDAKYGAAARAARAMAARFHALVEEHRRAPRDDFTQLLLRDGAHLSDDEIVHTLMFVLFAGHETTTNLIASGVLWLVRTPGLMARLRAEPGRVADAVEELLRMDGPVQMVFRLAREDVEYGGTTIRAGERVHLVLNAANRDPSVFERPDELDIERGRSRHVSFGPGAHFCLGAPLARLEARVALQGLLARFDRLELEPAAAPLAWRPELVIHGLKALPLRYATRGANRGGDGGGTAGTEPGDRPLPSPGAPERGPPNTRAERRARRRADERGADRPNGRPCEGRAGKRERRRKGTGTEERSMSRFGPEVVLDRPAWVHPTVQLHGKIRIGRAPRCG